MISIAQGGVGILHLTVRSSDVLTDLDAPPDVEVFRPNGASEETGTGTRMTEGVYDYAFNADNAAPTGSWWIEWSGTLGGTPVSAVEFFTVTPPDEAPAVSGVFAAQSACAAWAEAPTCTIDGASSSDIAVALASATDALWWRTGRRLGLCAVSVRPCSQAHYTRLFGHGWNAVLLNGQWLNTCGAPCMRTSCHCGGWLSEIMLSPGPVAEITSVTIDGEVLVEGIDYRCDGNRLVRLGGHRWPVCQDLTVGNAEVGAFTVNYLVGVDVPELGKLAAADLACEILRAIKQDGKCKLPRRITNITRQGVTMNTVLDPQLFFDQGLTGLYLADLFISGVNPAHLAQPSRAYNIDRLLANRQVRG